MVTEKHLLAVFSGVCCGTLVLLVALFAVSMVYWKLKKLLMKQTAALNKRSEADEVTFKGNMFFFCPDCETCTQKKRQYLESVGKELNVGAVLDDAMLLSLDLRHRITCGAEDREYADAELILQQMEENMELNSTNQN